MTMKEYVTQGLEQLDEPGIRQVADFVAFLQFRSSRSVAPYGDETKIAALYAEFAEEDRALAEAGMADYAAGLAKEDAAS